jgi:hypothetical protein
VIPRVAHLVWLGRTLPWTTVLAAASARARGGFERVVLHHDGALGDGAAGGAEGGAGGRGGAGVLAALGARDVEARRLRPDDVAERAGGPALVDVLRRLTQPAGRVNVLRAAILAVEGGVYLDADTVTVRTLGPLCATAGAFCGEERIVFPAALLGTRSPLAWAVAGLRHAARDLMRRHPDGWRAFRVVEPLYARAVNNAVLASAPGHPFLQDLLARMTALPRERQTVRFALGTHLLQRAVAEWRPDAAGAHGPLVVHPPRVFYPLAPELSAHWIRERADAPAAARAFLAPDTRVVHWYASVRTRGVEERLRPETLDALAPRVPLAWLARAALDPAEVFP